MSALNLQQSVASAEECRRGAARNLRSAVASFQFVVGVLNSGGCMPTGAETRRVERSLREAMLLLDGLRQDLDRIAKLLPPAPKEEPRAAE